MSVGVNEPMKTILIVEDNEKNMKLVRDILRHKGHATIEAATGEDGVRLAREAPPDLILMDIQLPDIDGIEALRRIREDPALDAMPVIAVSASVMPDDQQKIVSLGLRCLRHQADQPEAVPRHRAALSRRAAKGDSAMTPRRPRRRRRRAQRQAARRPARGEGLPDLHRELGRRGARARSPPSRPTWSCST